MGSNDPSALGVPHRPLGYLLFAWIGAEAVRLFPLLSELVLYAEAPQADYKWHLRLNGDFYRILRHTVPAPGNPPLPGPVERGGGEGLPVPRRGAGERGGCNLTPGKQTTYTSL